MKKLSKSKWVLFMLVMVLIGSQCFFVLGANAASPDPDKHGNSNTDMSLAEMKNKAKDVNVTVLESDSNHTVVRFDINNFKKSLVDINGKTYYNINCDGTSVAEEQGMPLLPRVCRSITIPNDANVKLNVLSSEYKEYKNFPVAPSKGSITRDKNPDSIPYTFSAAYNSGNLYPSQLASLSEPFIMRELRGTTIKVNPFQYRASNETLRVYSSITVEVVNETASAAVNTIAAPKTNTITADFEPAYANTFINFSNTQSNVQSLMNNPSETGSMLVICYDSYASAMDSFVQWKNSKGISTTLVNMSTVSSTNSASQIKTYIQNYYNAHPTLTYVLLVGDYAQVSSPTYSDGVSDPEYTKVAGNDNYPDIYVGRFSAQSVADVQTQVQRSIEFEQNGYNTAAYFKKGVGIASAEGSGETDQQHMNTIKSKLTNYGYTQVDSIYDPSAAASSVTTSLNGGRGIINYCGHGAETYWVTTGFSNTNVASLQNAGQLPFILSVSCVSGKFHTGTCFAEAWMRSKNSSGNPVGAIGTLMSTVNQPWTPPMNGQDGIIDLLTTNARVSLGGLCYSGETVMLDNGTSDDILTFNTWTVFGDPSIQILPSGSTPPVNNDTYEPNDTTGQAYAITSGTAYDSYVYTASDVDYYKFTIDSTGTISVNLTNLPKDYDLYLLNSAGTQVAKSENGSTTAESISYSATSTGTYYVKVSGYNGAYSTATKYQLKATYPTGTSTGQWYYETKTYDSPHNYTNNYNGTNTYTKTGATKVQVHFSRFETESGYDYVYIKDKSGTTKNSYNGTLSAFWAAVDGDTININLVSDGSVTAYGYHIDQVAYYANGQLIVQNVSIDGGTLAR